MSTSSEKLFEHMEGERGDLMEVPFGKVFARFCRQGRTGFLDIRDKPAPEGGKILKRVIMAHGASFAVKGGTAQETLPEILLANKKISQETYDKLHADTGGDYNKMEQMAMSGSVIPPGEIADAVTHQTEVKIRQLFSLIRGTYELKPQQKSAILKHGPMTISPEKLVLEGCREHYPEARIKKEFPDIENKSFSVDPEFESRLVAAGVAPKVIRVIKNMQNSFNWQSAVKSLPFDSKEASAFLLGLYFAGILTFPAEQEDFPVGKAYEAPEQRKKESAKKEPAKAGKETKKEEKKEEKKPPEEKKLPVEEMLDRELSDEEFLEEIDKRLETALSKETTYLDILGVDENTRPDKIKKIYFKFARRFHPDARPDLFQGEVREKVEDLFTKISEAYDVLGDDKKRSEYIKALRSKVSQEDMDKAQRAIEAEMEFQKAEILLNRSKWSEARELLEKAVELQPEEPEYGMYLAWIDYKLKGPSGAGQARSKISKVLEQRPKAADGYYYLAMIDKDEGEMAAAEKNLEKAQQLKPRDTDIKRELMLVRRKREAPSSQEKKGKGLFGKKK
ncbi:MAG: DnaJ domain-containing protein [bacterium]